MLQRYHEIDILLSFLSQKSKPSRGKLIADYQTWTQLVQNTKPTCFTNEASSHFLEPATLGDQQDGKNSP